jgi:hypothetical protein
MKTAPVMTAPRCETLTDISRGDATPGEALMSKNTGGRERASHEDIAQLAYHRWEERGRPDGSDVDDWLSAERELSHHFE